MASFHNQQQIQNQAGTQRVVGSVNNTVSVQRQEYAEAAQRGHHIAHVFANDQSFVHLGDVYHFGYNQAPDEVKAFGLCLGSAP